MQPAPDPNETEPKKELSNNKCMTMCATKKQDMKNTTITQIIKDHPLTFWVSLLATIITVGLFIGSFFFNSGAQKIINFSSSEPVFRSKPKNDLTEKEVNESVKKFDFFVSKTKQNNIEANPESQGFTNRYIAQNSIILDTNSGLMWQRDGSEMPLGTLEMVNKYIENLNTIKLEGYSDWRLPTVEEALSLIEPNGTDGQLYIDPIFNTQQWAIATSDKHPNGGIWQVFLINNPKCIITNSTDYEWVRAVR